MAFWGRPIEDRDTDGKQGCDHRRPLQASGRGGGFERARAATRPGEHRRGQRQIRDGLGQEPDPPEEQ